MLFSCDTWSNNADKIQDALNHINPSELTRNEWRDIGFGLKDCGAPLEVFDEWSKRDPDRYSESGHGSPEEIYATAIGSGIRIGTVYYYAKNCGWSCSDAFTPLSWDSGLDDSSSSCNFELRSPIDCEALSPEEQLSLYLKTLFRPEEHISFVTNSYWNRTRKKWEPHCGIYSKTANQLISELDSGASIDEVIGKANHPESGAWIRINPVDGVLLPAPTRKDTNKMHKDMCNENVTRWDYALIECDDISIPESLKMYFKYRLPMVAIVLSGSRSAHAIIRIDAKSMDEWNERVKKTVYPLLTEAGLKLDTQNTNCSRLSRLPGFMRGETMQKLIYVNPSAQSFENWYQWVLTTKKNVSNNISGYFISNNQLFYRGPSELIHICDGVLKIEEINTVTDGIDSRIEFVIGGCTYNGTELNKARIPADRFASPRTWITTEYPAEVILDHRQTAGAYLIEYLMNTARTAKRTTTPSCLGYNIIDNKLDYVTANGAIMNDSVHPQLPENLTAYAMNDIPEGYSMSDCINSVFRILDTNNINLTGPVLSFGLIPPIFHYLKSCNVHRFSLYIVGNKATGKTETGKFISALFASKIFEVDGAPLDFTATLTGAELTASASKDVILLVDDNHPSTDAIEQKKHSTLLRNLVRGSANGSGKVRGTSDIRVRSGKAPRAWICFTGEDRQSIEQSCIDRMFFVEAQDSSLVQYKKSYENSLRDVRNGLVTAAMYQYIKYIIVNSDAFTERLTSDYKRIKDEAEATYGITRLAEHVALLETALVSFLTFSIESGATTKAEASKLYKKVTASIHREALDNQNELDQADPVKLYLDALRTIVSQDRTVSVYELQYEKDFKKRELIGFFDDDYYYLDSALAQIAVVELYQRQGIYYNTSKIKISKLLKARNIIVPGVNGTPTHQKTIAGKNRKLLWFSRKILDEDN